VDDHEVVRVGLRSLIERDTTMEVVGEAASAASAVTEALRLRPDVVVMDVRLPDDSGITACRELRAQAPDVRVMMLTSYADDEAVFAAVMAGAAGYVLKQVSGHDFLRAIESVAAGMSLLDPAITEAVLSRLKQCGASDPLAALSAQEGRVLECVAEGKTNKEIGAALALSEKTVKNYLANIFQKLQISRRAEGAALFSRGDRAIRP